MPVETIADVIKALDEIIDRAEREGSRLGYFAALYRRVTVEVAEGIRTGRFEDGPRMERFDVAFARRYVEAYASYQAEEAMSRSWLVAFQAAADADPIVLQHLVLAMNAHINLDLGIAAAEVAPGAQLPALRNDFEEINRLLASLVDDVSDRLARIWPWLYPIDLIAGRLDESLIGFSIDVAREHAWRMACQVAAAENEDERGDLIDRIDRCLELFGQALWRPGPLTGIALAAIRLGEFGGVRTIIDKLK